MKKDKDTQPEVTKYNEEIHTRSLRQIAADAAKPKEEVKEEKPELEVKAEVVAEKRKDDKVKEREETRKKETEDLIKKTAEETAAKVKEDTTKEFEAKIAEILNKDKSMEDKQKEADELVASYVKENRQPKNWQETVDEQARIMEKRQEIRERERAETQAKTEAESKIQQEKETKDREEMAKKSDEERRQAFTNQITKDIDELCETKFMARPTDFNEINNLETKDANAKEIQKLLQFGVELNTTRVKEGKEPVSSLSKIYFMHYKPTLDAKPKNDQPAGADAPIAGGNNTPSNESKQITYEQLHKESFAQLASRIARESFNRAKNL